MLRYTEEGEKLKDKSRCAPIRAELKMCLLESECCKTLRLTPRQCLMRNDATVPDQCRQLRQLMFDCKHSMIDARRRFRGIKGVVYD